MWYHYAYRRHLLPGKYPMAASRPAVITASPSRGFSGPPFPQTQTEQLRLNINYLNLLVFKRIRWAHSTLCWEYRHIIRVIRHFFPPTHSTRPYENVARSGAIVVFLIFFFLSENKQDKIIERQELWYSQSRTGGREPRWYNIGIYTNKQN